MIASERFRELALRISACINKDSGGRNSLFPGFISGSKLRADFYPPITAI